jgi:hypothetical protein
MLTLLMCHHVLAPADLELPNVLGLR